MPEFQNSISGIKVMVDLTIETTTQCLYQMGQRTQRFGGRMGEGGCTLHTLRTGQEGIHMVPC